MFRNTSRNLVLLLMIVLFAPHLFLLLANAKPGARSEGGALFMKGEIVYDTTNPLVEVDEKELKNIGRLNKIVMALYKYENEHYSFPVSAEDGSQWSRRVTQGDEWIKGLVPGYIDELPRYERRDKDSKARFSYHSRGDDFKLIAHMADDCEEVRAIAQQLVDPARPGCVAYGYWTKGAVRQ